MATTPSKTTEVAEVGLSINGLRINSLPVISEAEYILDCNECSGAA